MIGLALGLTFRKTKQMSNLALRTACSIAAIVIGVGAGILGVKSITESILYAQPFAVRAGKNIYAFVADLVVLIISLPICMTLDKTARKVFPKLVK